MSECLGNKCIDRRGGRRVHGIVRGAKCRPSARTEVLEAKHTRLINIITPGVGSRSVDQVATKVRRILSTEKCRVLLTDASGRPGGRLVCLEVFRDCPMSKVMLVNAILASRRQEFLGRSGIPIIIIKRRARVTDYVCRSSFNTKETVKRRITLGTLGQGNKEPRSYGVTCVNIAHRSGTTNTTERSKFHGKLRRTKVAFSSRQCEHRSRFAVDNKCRTMISLLDRRGKVSVVSYTASAVTTKTVRTLVTRDGGRIPRSIRGSNTEVLRVLRRSNVYIAKFNSGRVLETIANNVPAIRFKCGADKVGKTRLLLRRVRRGGPIPIRVGLKFRVIGEFR